MEYKESFFCFYCGKKAELIYKELRQSFKGKMVILNNVPLYFCRSCREIFYPSFVIDIFNKMAKLELDSKRYEFEQLFDLYGSK